MEIRDRIRQILAENADWTPRSISLKAGLSDSMLHKFLTGQTKSMTVDTLQAVADALGVNPRWLMWGDAPRQVPENLVHLWDHIPEARKRAAIRVLEAFAEDEEVRENG